MTATRPPLGYIGMGVMGVPMTLRLLAAGHGVSVWNRNAAKTAPVVAKGAKACASPAEVARAAEVVFTCVTDTAAMEAVVFGPDGIVHGGGAGKILVDMSSIRPERTRAMAADLKARTGMGWVDAPVSGGVPGAEAGTLAVMAGGEAADVEAVRPLVAHLAQRFTHMGPSGSGQIAKLCNQVIVGGTIAVVAEALNLASRAGIRAGALPEALKGGFADSNILQNHGRRMIEADLAPRGNILTMIKDMDTAVDLGRASRAPVPMTSLTTELYRLLVAQGHLDVDQIGLIKLYADGPL